MAAQEDRLHTLLCWVLWLAGAHVVALDEPAPAGVAAGIAFRIRAFLYLGTTFVVLSLVSMVWHASRAIEHVWPWWAFCIGTGVLLLVMFGLYEKRKADALRLLDRLRQWER